MSDVMIATEVPVEEVPRPEVASLGGFLEAVDEFLTPKWIFRGVNNALFRLQPSIGRFPDEPKQLREVEERLFKQFQRESVPYLQSRPQNPWQWLALAQHHGVPTRLLDWSESPFVSLYFAVWGDDQRDASVFVAPRPEKFLLTFDDNPLTITETVYFYPEYASPRIAAQRGLFTAHPEPQLVYSPAEIRQIIIKAEAKPEIRRKLDAIGVHHSSLFPDLDGLSRRLVSLEGYRRAAAASQLPPPPGETAPAPVSIDDAVEARAAPAKAKPVRKMAAAPPSRLPPPVPAARHNPQDPQKGQWGGLARTDDWGLEAEVEETSEGSNWYRIALTVRARTAAARRAREVEFHLHDSFRKPVLTKPVKAGVGKLTVTAYGAFTVGARILPSGAVLELDLSELESAPPRFRSR